MRPGFSPANPTRSSLQPPPLPPRRRSILITLLALLIIAGAALGSIISVFAFLKSVSHHYGSAGTLQGILGIIVAPPLTFIAGIAFLMRRPWSRIYLIVLCLWAMGSLTWSALHVQREDRTTLTPSGVRVTVTGGNPWRDAPLIATIGALLGILLLPRVRAEFSSGAPSHRSFMTPSRNWRVGHRGRDCMYYEELRDGTWERIDIDGEMLTGRAHHVIFFKSVSDWDRYPEWARGRRDEIIARVKSEFREPDYEYHGD